MQEEGVIKYDLQFTPAEAVSLETPHELNAWRRILWQLDLIGQIPERYGGYGFGNVSQRIAPFDTPTGQRRFIISGTQTGHLAKLDNAHYATVSAYHPETNRIIAEGPIKPSSEALTHGAIYDLDDHIMFILHVHSPDIWQAAATLKIPDTDANVPYGTPAMAREVQRLFAETDVKQKKIFTMRGHEDGVVTFGSTAQEAGRVLIDTLAPAYMQTC